MSIFFCIFKYEKKKNYYLIIKPMKDITFDYLVVFCDKKTRTRNIAVYNGTFDQVYKIAKSLLSKKNYILDIKRA